ncbi:thioredoxin family protein [Evansella cellulosilytica]|uniref:Thiol-disulfide isomerase n=1 Tax=Evansella cellulosilytica (strain ATCC 21833 / DSM 2522 / FERM P-1141 / JCM 9156 / N-4) TaxID=649639 RepID=E6TYR2_EVAC2|nr:thioredoxin family protein [Evansella cellulosilytica]ADU31247.1 thiol-disulfide isomerase [Evansella cellulosilytica DSM 2522]
MKKVIIFGLIIVIIFAALAFVTSQQNKQQSEGNPFGKDQLHRETLNQLDNPLYQNVIIPEELNSKLENEETVTVYFYSPTCEYCNEATPVLVPLAEQLGVDVVLFNLLEFNHGFNDYNIDYTPTLVHYENGVEVSRKVGLFNEAAYEQFYREDVLGE